MANKELLITNGTIYTPNGIIKNGYIHVSGGKIISIKSGHPPNSSGEIIDASGKLILPGLIDIHVNGGGGSLSVDGTTEAIINIAKAHAKHGTTGMVTTTITVTDQVLKDTVRAIAQVAENPIKGARILGTHLEGPFLNPEKRGAHNKDYLRSPSISFFDELYDLARGTLKILSLAPELKGAIDLVKHARRRGVLVGLAHSSATYEETLEAIHGGLSLCTHIFNAMPPLHHRKPGPIGAFLAANNNTFIELISDGIHVHPSVMDIVIKAKGSDAIALVTDAVTPAGTDIKEFSILGVNLEVRGVACYLPNGGLAGSALTMNKAVKIVSSKTSATFEEALKMASLNPAKFLGIDEYKGSLDVGKDADILISDDALDILATIVEGNVVYQK